MRNACKQSRRQDFVIWDEAMLVSEIFWHLADKTPDMEGVKVIKAFVRAFAEWQPFLHPIVFTSTSEKEKANIVINFAHDGDADLPEPFGSAAVLAYAYFPVDNYSEMWFDESESWGSMSSSTRIDLFKVAVHELGHSLGLGHTDAKKDIMLPFYDPDTMVKITPDSSAAIDLLYGEFQRELDTLPLPEPEPEPEPIPEPDPPQPSPEPVPPKPVAWWVWLIIAALLGVTALAAFLAG